jgi:hypothetical protein
MSDWLRLNWSCLDATRTARRRRHNRCSTVFAIQSAAEFFSEAALRDASCFETRKFSVILRSRCGGWFRPLRYVFAQRAQHCGLRTRFLQRHPLMSLPT